MSTDPRAVGWAIRTQALRFLLGESLLFSRSFPALVLDIHFSKLAQNPGLLRVPVERLSSGIECAIIYSHPVESDFPRLSLLKDSIRYVPEHLNHFYVELRPSFPEYLKNLDPKSRHELQRKIRRFRAVSGESCWRQFRSPDEMQEFHRLAGEVSKKTYQERLLNVGLPSGENFKRQLVDLAHHDQVRGYILFLDAGPIAYGYCCAQEDVLNYAHTGYDPDFPDLSPGIVLLNFMLESLFTEGRFQLLDFGGGSAQWKRSYATGTSRFAIVYYFRRTSANLLLVASHIAVGAFSDAVVKLLAMLGVKERIKKLFRRGLNPFRGRAAG